MPAESDESTQQRIAAIRMVVQQRMREMTPEQQATLSDTMEGFSPKEFTKLLAAAKANPSGQTLVELNAQLARIIGETVALEKQHLLLEIERLRLATRAAELKRQIQALNG
jgi:hypothetical protein